MLTTAACKRRLSTFHYTATPILLICTLLLGFLGLCTWHARMAKADQPNNDTAIELIGGINALSSNKNLPNANTESSFVSGLYTQDDTTASADSGMEIYAIDLGNETKGDAVLVSSGPELMLMDLGTSGGYDKIVQALDEYGAPKDGKTNDKRLSLYFSHFHGDHTGGLQPGDTLQRLLGTYSVSAIYIPDESIYNGKLDNSDYVNRGTRICNMATTSEDGVEIIRLKAGSTFLIGDAMAQVLGPVGVDGFTNPGSNPTSTGDEDSGAWGVFINNCSLVTKITCGNTSFLTTGDAQEESETALASAYGQQLKADIYKLAHHGMGGNTKDFLDCVKPRYTFGTNNGFTQLSTHADGTSVRRTYAAKQKASAYGLCYMLGEESAAEGDGGFVLKADGNSTLCYRHKDQTAPLAGGIVRTVGSFGEDRGGGDYDFYDYYLLDQDGFPIGGVQSVSIGGVEGKRLFSDGGQLYAHTGWHKYTEGQLQYVYGDTALLAEGFNEIEGSTYYFSPSANCSRVYGLQKIGKYYYLFTEEGGKLYTNKWYNNTTSNDKSHWMYFGSDGKRASNLKTIGSDIYYLDPKTGYRAVGPKKIGSYYYCFKDSGKAYANTTKTFNGYACTFNKKGVWTNKPSLAQPAIASVSRYGSKKLKVTWTAKPGSTGYVLYMATSKAGKYVKVATIKNAKTTSYIRGSLKSSKTYYFKVRSYKTVMGFNFFSPYSKVASGKAK